jgi:hypothetical protein
VRTRFSDAGLQPSLHTSACRALRVFITRSGCVLPDAVCSVAQRPPGITKNAGAGPFEASSANFRKPDSSRRMRPSSPQVFTS